MSSGKAKKTIKKVAKTVGKTLGKGSLKLGAKGIELVGRGTVKTVDALITNPKVQEIATTLGMVAAAVGMPSAVTTIGTVLIAAEGFNIMMHAACGKKWSLAKEVKGILNLGNKVTESVSNKILSPTLRNFDRYIAKTGKKTQEKIDDWFK